ncbi:MAG: S8 family peptidase [Bacteriovoracaceae bacterium]
MTAIMATSLSLSALSMEYVVKLKNKNLKSLSNLEKFGEVTDLNVRVGNFVVLKSQQKLAQIIDPNIEYVEENITFTINTQDEKFEDQWGLKNTGTNSGSIFFPGKKGVDIDAEEAWKITKGDSSIKIAVIDTGVDYTHKDLVKNLMVNEAEKNGVEGIDDDGNGFVDDIYGYDFANNDGDPMDGHGHGTHCAGVIGASHDTFGIAGVMDNAQILSIKFLTDSGGGTLSAAIQAIDYAIQRGVDIMSNSWGGGGYTQALYDVIEEANKAGITFVAAAGNSRSDNDAKPAYPASYELDNVISVGALDGKGKKASFSNYGKKSVHVFAPGVDILSTVTDNKHKKMSGTSMAAPHVSGIVGLLLSVEPNKTPLEVRDRLLNSTIGADDLSDYSQAGYISAHKTIQ